MTVISIKRVIAACAALALAVVLVGIIALASGMVRAATTGADPAAIFTDAALSMEAERPTTWVSQPGDLVAEIDLRTRRQLASLWHDAMVLRIEGSSDSPGVHARFEPSLLAGFSSGSTGERATIVHHTVQVQSVSPDGHLVTLTGRTETRHRTQTISESFRTTMALRATGWTMTSLVADGLTSS